MVEVGKLLRSKISATLISRQTTSIRSSSCFLSMDAITITDEKEITSTRQMLWRIYRVYDGLSCSQSDSSFKKENYIKGCKQSNFKYGTGRRQPTSLPPANPPCTLILRAICRGSHETNTVITCPPYGASISPAKVHNRPGDDRPPGQLRLES